MATERPGGPPGEIPGELKEQLESVDWAVRKEAVQALGILLVKASTAAVANAAAGHLEQLAGDEKWEVRNAVAGTLQHLLHPNFDRIIARLIQDPNGYVRRKAAQTLQRRRQMALLPEHAGGGFDVLLREINQLRSRYSHDVANRALRIGRTYYEATAADTTHDILNVLTALKQSLRTLERLLVERKASRAKWEPVIENAKRRCTIIEHIARDMKTLAERSESAFHRENVSEMVKEAVSIVEDRFQHASVVPRVTTTVVIDDTLTVDAPRVRLVRALTNVIKNSYESFARKGAVSITARTSGEDLILEVADDGCGMSEEVRRSAFVPGRSTKKGRAGRTDNTGMGLAIAAKVVQEECGGEIRIDSTEGRGTTVTIVLPLSQRAGGAD